MFVLIAYVRSCPWDWCVFAGSWAVGGRALLDGMPVSNNTPLAEIKDSAIAAKLAEFSSIASAIARIKACTNKRVFALASALGDLYGILAAYAGGLDGVYPDVEVEGEQIDIVGRWPHALELAEKRGGHVIVEDVSLKTLAELATRTSKAKLVYASDWRDSLSELDVEFDVILLKSVPRDLVKVGVLEVPDSIKFYRCRRCRLDYLTEERMRTCPRCSGRVFELLSYHPGKPSPREVRSVLQDNLEWLGKYRVTVF